MTLTPASERQRIAAWDESSIAMGVNTYTSMQNSPQEYEHLTPDTLTSGVSTPTSYQSEMPSRVSSVQTMRRRMGTSTRRDFYDDMEANGERLSNQPVRRSILPDLLNTNLGLLSYPGRTSTPMRIADGPTLNVPTSTPIWIRYGNFQILLMNGEVNGFHLYE